MDNKGFFNKKFGDTYIPENAEDEIDYYTFEKLDNQAREFWEENQKDILDHIDYNSFLNEVISILDWQFPSTVMEEVLMYGGN